MSDLPVIPSTQVTVGAFNRLWVTRITINPGASLSLSAVPYDGLGNTLRAPITNSFYHARNDAALSVLTTQVAALCQAKAGRVTAPFLIHVSTPAPAEKGTLSAFFRVAGQSKPDIVTIPDLFAAADADPSTAVLVGALLTWIAQKQVPAT